MDMDQLMEASLGADEDAQTYTAGVPIPGRQQWPFSRPEFTEMRAGRTEPELATSAGGASYPPLAEYGSSPSPGAAWHGALHEPELARNLAEIQIDDIFEDVDVADLISGPALREPTLTELNAGDDLNELSLDFGSGGGGSGGFGERPLPPLRRSSRRSCSTRR
ncbi:uncharacterized protein LOC119089954 [Pollicipes pollicipes]|uniref:uncharacterized protein LOC119089954 n=1 Tax=Pollicipes pollicipes TaxID=41117 RepID=UPI0018857E61|nr:uncharacterized protein LOC119089954 [Pollicipes pollicipes]